MVKIVFYISIIGLLFFGCKKYPEDHKITFVKPFKRITAHPWKIGYIEINGVDKTHFGFDMPNANKYGIDLTQYLYRFTTAKIEDTNSKDIFLFEWVNAPYHSDSNRWRFMDHKKNLSFAIGNYGYQNLLGIQNAIGNWKIVKLTDSDLIVSISDENGGNYKINFIK